MNSSAFLAQKEESNVLSVEGLINLLNSTISQIGTVKVRGEISDVSVRDGMAFFDLKDSSGVPYTAKCFLGRWNYERFSHLMEAGLEVIVQGRPSVYKSGFLRLLIESVEPVGEGALRKAFEALKKKLEAKGYFDPSRKRPVPEFIQKIGVITSEAGEVIHDFRRHLGEYGFQIYLMDVRVDGDYAEQSIVSAIQWFNKSKLDIDILVLIRGGGGLENLKAFNSETIADAIVLSRLPIITGIGHERDETIADYAADGKFSTPTAVAVFIRTQRENLITQVEGYSENLISAMNEIFDSEKEYITDRVDGLKTAFARILERYKFALSRTAERMHNGLNRIFREFKVVEQKFLRLIYHYEGVTRNKLHTIDIVAQQCLNLLERKFNSGRGRLEIAEAALLPLNPEAVLRRGYSIAYRADRKVLKEAKDTAPGEEVFIKLYKGKITSRVEEVED